MKNSLSTARINRIRAQGYHHYSDKQIADLAFGNRFAYRLCSGILAIGVLSANVPLLSFMLAIALLGIVLPNHPFDYLYNLLLAKRMNKPRLPPRSRQLKFACSVATLWIAGTIFLFHNGFQMAGYLAGTMLAAVAILVSTIDYCIPSVIYNAMAASTEDRSHHH